MWVEPGNQIQLLVVGKWQRLDSHLRVPQAEWVDETVGSFIFPARDWYRINLTNLFLSIPYFVVRRSKFPVKLSLLKSL